MRPGGQSGETLRPGSSRSSRPVRPRVLQKLTAPRADGVVRRARVCKTLERALRAGIAWLSAPAGYGKTSVLADLVRGRAGPHVWYRMDEADQDVASFFHHMALTLRPPAPRLLPVFGPEYADQPQAFARRFFRAYFARLRDGTLLVLDDLHHADVPEWRGVLRALLLELPEGVRCACLSRSLPPEELDELTLAGRLALVGQSELDGAALALGPKAPTRSLDIVRFLAVSKDHRCALEDLYEWLWPDADGDQAKAACEQALHRLRKLLGRADLVLQRDGALRLSREHVFVDLDGWELGRKRLSQARNAEAGAEAQAERLFWNFAGPLFHSLPSTAWSVPAAERVRAELIDLCALLAARAAARGDAPAARSLYLRALEFYPDSERCHEALARGRLAQGDVAGALDDYRRYLRILQTGPQTRPSAALRALMAPHLRRRRSVSPSGPACASERGCHGSGSCVRKAHRCGAAARAPHGPGELPGRAGPGRPDTRRLERAQAAGGGVELSGGPAIAPRGSSRARTLPARTLRTGPSSVPARAFAVTKASGSSPLLGTRSASQTPRPMSAR